MPDMCHDTDGRPPIPPIAGGAADAGSITLRASDGTSFRGFRARPSDPSHAAVLILPDVRGLHPFYEDLAQRFAEHGFDSLAIDWFGRTAGDQPRPADWEYMPHVEQASWEQLQDDIRAAAASLREELGDDLQALFTVGFCFGGRASFLSATLGLDLAGVIGFYGALAEKGRANMPAPAALADRFESPVLGLFGGADQSIPPELVAGFDSALEQAGVEHQLITYPDAPHSFFDRKAADFASESAAAWDEVLTFIRERGAQIGA
jgi:carboxymethylenebutenolidase